MSKEIRTILLGAAALTASVAAGAQTAAPTASRQAEPTTSQAAPYSSAFEGYRPFSSDEVGDWRKANDTVREIGGWRAYAREIQGGSPPAPSAVPARPAAPANPHQGQAR
jgi:hypothetical protein